MDRKTLIDRIIEGTDRRSLDADWLTKEEMLIVLDGLEKKAQQAAADEAKQAELDRLSRALMKLQHDRLEDAELRMEVVLLLAGMLNGGAELSEPLLKLLDEEDDDALIRCFPSIPKELLAARHEDTEIWHEEFFRWAVSTNLLGYVVQFATPVMKHRGLGSMFTWGHFYTRWVYGDTMNDVVKLGLAWAEERRSAERARK